jgi:agmatine deiminase
MRGLACPKDLGYCMPAEWERHEATWLTWPNNPDTFPKGIIEPVEKSYIKIIEALADGEKVNVLIDDKGAKKRILNLLAIKKNVFFHKIKAADVWIRDYGPIFVKKENEVAATKWIFNSWGSKYQELKGDDEVGVKMARLTGNRIFKPGIVLEGGSIDTNGLGTAITTEQCLLNKNRNPTFNKAQIQGYLSSNLGFKNIIWLKEGIEGDDTDGHIDDIARFVNKDTIVCAVESNKEDKNYTVLRENFELLKESQDQDGNNITIISLPMPRRIKAGKRRLPASYTNFYIGNSTVVLPIFNDVNDKKAISIMKNLFPDRKIVGIESEALVYGYGGIHCITQQQPAI